MTAILLLLWTAILISDMQDIWYMTTRSHDPQAKIHCFKTRLTATHSHKGDSPVTILHYIYLYIVYFQSLYFRNTWYCHFLPVCPYSLIQEQPTKYNITKGFFEIFLTCISGICIHLGSLFTPITTAKIKANIFSAVSNRMFAHFHSLCMSVQGHAPNSLKKSN